MANKLTALAAAVSAVTALTACDGIVKRSATTVTVTAPSAAATVTVTATPSTPIAPPTTLGLQPGERSSTFPLVRVPYGAIRDRANESRSIETWRITGVPFDEVVAYFNATLPIGNYLSDLPYCKDQPSPKLVPARNPYWWAYWQWSDGWVSETVRVDTPSEDNSTQVTTISFIRPGPSDEPVECAG